MPGSVQDANYSWGSKTPDVFGGGMQKFDSYKADYGAYNKSAQNEQYKKKLQEMQNLKGNQKAPTNDQSMVNQWQASQGKAAQGQAVQLGAAQNAQAGQIGKLQGADAANINRSEDQQIRAMQLQQLGNLQNAYAGNGPSLAGGILRQGQEQANKNQMAILASTGGRNAALGGREAAIQAAAGNQQTASNAAQAKIQEQQIAGQQLNDLAQGVRGQDIGVNTAQAGFQQGANLQNAQLASQAQMQQAQMNQQNSQFNTGNQNQFLLQNNANMNQFGMANLSNQQAMNLANLGYQNQAGQFNTGNLNQNMWNNSQIQQTQSGLNNQMTQYLLGAEQQGNQFEQTAEMQYEQDMMKQMQAQNELKQKAYANASQANANTFGSFMGMGGAALGALSDQTEKKSINRGTEKIKRWLDVLNGAVSTSDATEKTLNMDKLEAYDYKYKNPEKPGAGHGNYTSVMAQDLEKSGEVGKSMVKTGPDGKKYVDYGKGFSAMLAAEVVNHKRISKLEKQLQILGGLNG